MVSTIFHNNYGRILEIQTPLCGIFEVGQELVASTFAHQDFHIRKRHWLQLMGNCMAFAQRLYGWWQESRTQGCGNKRQMNINYVVIRLGDVRKPKLTTLHKICALFLSGGLIDMKQSNKMVQGNILLFYFNFFTWSDQNWKSISLISLTHFVR